MKISEKKVKISIFIKPEIARAMKIQVARQGCRGISEYVAQMFELELDRARSWFEEEGLQFTHCGKPISLGMRCTRARKHSGGCDWTFAGTYGEKPDK